MADLTITAANVIPASDTPIGEGTAGGTIVAGNPLYIDAADSNKLKPCDSTSAAKAACVGIAVNSASSGQPVKYARAQTVAMGSVFTVGAIFVVSENAGGIAPIADLGSAEFVTIIGVATSATELYIGIVASGVAKA